VFTLRTIRVPYALPSLFAAAKIAVPGALPAAVLAERLITSGDLDHQRRLLGAVGLGGVSLLLYSTVGAVDAALAQDLTP
jgi:ABC-type nitrate/sulfonate/bicarbonate transport system permease component